MTAVFTLAGTLAVEPVGTVTGWRRHLILGRDLGLWTCCLAGLDLFIAAVTAPSGWLDGTGGSRRGRVARPRLGPLDVAPPFDDN